MKTWKEHLEHLEEVFKALQEADLKIKQSKCEFFKSKVHYPGYLVGVDGVEPLPEKLETIQKPAAPHNVDELRQFLGLTGFYRKFVPFYADITQCLTKLLRKGIRYEWSDQCESPFNTLIEELCKAPTLQYPDPNRPYELFTDASHYCYSGILHQAKIGNPEQLIPIAYFSGCFNAAQLNYNVTMKGSVCSIPINSKISVLSGRSIVQPTLQS